MTLQFSIVIPAYNEAENIPDILGAFGALQKQYGDKHPFELVLVNNGSTDDSTEVINRLCSQSAYAFVTPVHVAKNIGYGHGIMSGIHAAQGQFLCWTHADLQTPPEDCFKALEILLACSDSQHTIAKGLRVDRPFGAWFFTFGMSAISTFVLGCILYDVNAQPKLFHRSFLHAMPLPPDDYSLDLYCLYSAKKQGYKIATFPVHFRPRIHGVSKWTFSFRSKLRTIWRTIQYIVRLRSRISHPHAVHHSSH